MVSMHRPSFRASGARRRVLGSSVVGAVLAATALLAGPLQGSALAAAGTPKATFGPGCIGVPVTPADDFPSIVQHSPAGSVFCLSAGVFRLPRHVVPLDGDVFWGAGSRNTGTVIRGDNPVTDWTQVDGLYQHVGGTEKIYDRGVPCFDNGDLCHYADWLFSNDQPLTRVLSPCSAANVVAGTFCIDYNADTMYMFDDPSLSAMTYSTSEAVFTAAANNRYLHMAIGWFANTPQDGAVVTLGDNSTATDVVFEYSHGTGVVLSGIGASITKSRMHHNGAKGIGAFGVDELIDQNQIDNNNTMGYDANQDAGGGKFTGSVNLTVSNNYVHDNHGNGLWFDSDNIGTLVNHNRTTHNLQDSSGGGDGIRIEKSCFITITNNSIVNNERSGIGITGGRDITIGGPGAGNEIKNSDQFGVRISANGYVRPPEPNCQPDGGVYQLTNIVTSYNKFVMVADSMNGLTAVPGVDITGTTFIGNTYIYFTQPCADLGWFWWDGTQKVWANWSTWQTTYLQDPSPDGTCRGPS